MLTPGARLGPYEIGPPLGHGGMGEVYRARDARLNRDVAIKVLLPAVAADPDRLARFRREAQTLAALNHPNIAHIHGLEDVDGRPALVMELVEGRDLRARLAEGPIPLDDALPIARQIAEALDAAHGQGIVHRDLKPANVMLRADGVVKVLDFGLAKAVDPSSSSEAAAALALSPTITSPAALTGAGVILGTAAYMSPEQARGKVVDKRSDLWALGAVLFEMLTGTRAFPGDDVPETIASVIAKEPDWSRLPARTPAAIRRLLRRSLVKDRKQRLSDAADARLEIDDALTPPSGDADLETQARPAKGPARSTAVIAALGLALTVAVALLVSIQFRRTSPPALLRLKAELGADAPLANAGAGAVATLSPDGAAVAFIAQKSNGGGGQLYVRRLSELQALPLPGTDEAASPFFSPDGQWVAFFAGGKLKKISVAGGSAVTLCDAPDGRGGDWGEDGTIVFAPDSVPGVRLQRVSSAGGKADPVTELAEGEVTQRWPQLLPGGKAVLFTSSRTTGAFGDATLVVQALPSGRRTIVQSGGYHGRYLTSGHLAFIRDGSLFVAPFDLGRPGVTAPPVLALEGVRSNVDTGGAQFAVSAGGTLVYLPQSASSGLPIQWMDHAGQTTTLRATPSAWSNLRFAPDGRRLALQILDGQADIWVYDWTRDTLARLTIDPGLDMQPVWTPDGRRITFASQRADKSTPNLYWQRVDGAGEAQRLTESRNPQFPASWHPSGAWLAFEEQNSRTGSDLMILPMEGDEASGWRPGTPTVFLNSAFAEGEPMFSPDGRWLAYFSNESGRNEVYVRPFPGPGGKWQVSTGGGTYPTWSRTRPELLFVNDGQLMVAPYAVEGDAFRAEKPRLWSEVRLVTSGGRMFDLHPDGARLALAASDSTAAGSKPDRVVFILNFFDELRRLAPSAKK